jgi:hypothetical protein
MPSTSDLERQEWNLLMYAMVVNLPAKVCCEKGRERWHLSKWMTSDLGLLEVTERESMVVVGW